MGDNREFFAEFDKCLWAAMGRRERYRLRFITWVRSHIRKVRRGVGYGGDTA